MLATHRPDGQARVVVTGIGMTAAPGNTRAQIVQALRTGTSGVATAPDYVEHGLRTTVAGRPASVAIAEATLSRKLRRFMGDTALYAFEAAHAAVQDAGLDADTLGSGRCGLVVGSGTGAIKEFEDGLEIARESGPTRVPPYVIPRAMSSTAQASLCAAFGIRGISYAISSACSTAVHCLGHATDLLRWGRQDVMLAGGSEEAYWGAAMCFDAMGALSRAHNATPGTASRPYDADRDGFVLGGGAAILVLETLDHARARGAHIFAEVTGYGAGTHANGSLGADAATMQTVIRHACAGLPAPVDYVCTHANGTVDGDLVELEALAAVFGGKTEVPPLSSIKALTGHTVGAAGAMQAACALWAMQEGFLPGSANIARLDPGVAGYPVLRTSRAGRIAQVLVNTFGFGGTYGALTFARL